jgi:hypothetical protein
MMIYLSATSTTQVLQLCFDQVEKKVISKLVWRPGTSDISQRQPDEKWKAWKTQGPSTPLRSGRDDNFKTGSTS